MCEVVVRYFALTCPLLLVVDQVLLDLDVGHVLLGFDAGLVLVGFDAGHVLVGFDAGHVLVSRGSCSGLTWSMFLVWHHRGEKF